MDTLIELINNYEDYRKVVKNELIEQLLRSFDRNHYRALFYKECIVQIGKSQRTIALLAKVNYILEKYNDAEYVSDDECFTFCQVTVDDANQVKELIIQLNDAKKQMSSSDTYSLIY